MSKRIDLIGQKFGRLTVICDSRIRNNSGNIIWACLCDCGNFTRVDRKSLIKGQTKSCGCLRRELYRTGKKNYKHGESIRGSENYSLYAVLGSMKARCNNINDKNYKTYGGKGVKVCKEWEDDYLAFKNWALKSGYEKGLSINRKDSNGDYRPINCQWITRSENSIQARKEGVARRIPIRFTTA